jgi:hypothetical protein
VSPGGTLSADDDDDVDDNDADDDDVDADDDDDGAASIPPPSGIGDKLEALDSRDLVRPFILTAPKDIFFCFSPPSWPEPVAATDALGDGNGISGTLNAPFNDARPLFESSTRPDRAKLASVGRRALETASFGMTAKERLQQQQSGDVRRTRLEYETKNNTQ